MVRFKKQSLFILFLIFFIFLSCVSKKQYLELESNYSDTQQRLEQQNKKLKEVEHSLINSEINKDNCLKDLFYKVVQCIFLQIRYYFFL